jgi:aspartate oxidase
MVAALRAAEAGARVLLLARTAPGTACNSAVSGGGFLVATARFTQAEHRALTMEAGRHINDPALVEVLCRRAPECYAWLEATTGLRMNPRDSGRGYWCPGGGATLTAKLAEAVARTQRITVRELTARQLLVADDTCYGVLAVDRDGATHRLTAAATVLATGGYAGLFARHDNAGNPIGAGVVMAARAGARVRDLEFVQFYPVAVAEPDLPTFMLFRPFPPGARLVTANGRDLLALSTVEGLAEVLDGITLNEAIGAYRDVLSRVIHAENGRGPVYLDVTGCDASQAERWPALQYLQRHGWDWTRRRVRIAPIAHHTMGGVWIDARARTSLQRLYAAGEVTGGVHGANRHGSNSLTDCLVFGCVAGEEAAGEVPLSTVPDASLSPVVSVPERAAFADLQRICWEGLGLVRDATTIAAAQRRLEALPPSDARLMATMVAVFAARRTESRGAHYRADHPAEDPTWQRSQIARLVGEEEALRSSFTRKRDLPKALRWEYNR